MNDPTERPIAEKWCDLSHANGSVVEATALSLRGRVRSVIHLLQAAGQVEGNQESVHQLRVWTRRTLATLEAYREVLPKSDRQWFRTQMKRIREAAGAARDLDVMIARFEKPGQPERKRLLSQLRRERKTADRSLRKLCEKLVTRPVLMKRLVRLLQKTKPVSIPLEHWVLTRLGRTLAAALSVAPDESADFSSLHRFRIELKHVRYTLEIFGGELPAKYRVELYVETCDTLASLGEINDHVSAAKYFAKKLRKSKGKNCKGRYRALRDEELQRAGQLRGSFLDSWPTRRLAPWLAEMQTEIQAGRQADGDLMPGGTPDGPAA